MPKSRTDPNLKLPEKTVLQLKNINHKLLHHGFDNIKVLNSIAVDELDKVSKSMSVHEFVAFIISKTYDLQKKGIVRDNARSIGKVE